MRLWLCVCVICSVLLKHVSHNRLSSCSMFTVVFAIVQFIHVCVCVCVCMSVCLCVCVCLHVCNIFDFLFQDDYIPYPRIEEVRPTALTSVSIWYDTTQDTNQHNTTYTTRYNMIRRQYNATWYDVVWSNKKQHNMIRNKKTQREMTQHDKTWSGVWYNTARYSTRQHVTTQYNIIKYDLFMYSWQKWKR